MNNHYIFEVETPIMSSTKLRPLIITLGGLIILLFGPVFLNLIKLWRYNDDYSHGFFVIPVSIYILYKRWDEIKNIRIRQNFLLIPFLVVFLLIYLAAVLVKFHALSYISFLTILFLTSLLIFGVNVTNKVLPAILFLIFMFPVPSEYYVQLITKLKILITTASFMIVSSFKIPIYQSGNLLLLPNVQLEVAEACSGIRSIYSYVMLGFLFSIMSRSIKNKITLLVTAVLLALVINISRVVITSVLSVYIGQSIAEGFFHQFSGIVLFIVGFIVLFGEYLVLSKVSTNSK